MRSGTGRRKDGADWDCRTCYSMPRVAGWDEERRHSLDLAQIRLGCSIQSIGSMAPRSRLWDWRGVAALRKSSGRIPRIEVPRGRITWVPRHQRASGILVA